ncbi:alpha/beta fold hydrolase [Solirhodobacter olei]|uniref:alpha/beta fold hydrolase n=1 Tax=Solirhodobacter olei TaxID=2493082 RepID=UPI000FDB14A6|nr:alpha/beta fold hydrolase [Solirhodobacter olei]
MPVQILFIQGAGEGVHDRWDSRLVESLERELGEGFVIRYPQMPNEGSPTYSVWKAALLCEFRSLEDGTIFVGHSVGATVLLHTLADEPSSTNPAAVVLIAAPFIGKEGWSSDDIKERSDFRGLLPQDAPIFLYHGIEDQIVPVQHARLYAKAIPQAVVRTLAHRDHQLNNSLKEIAEDIRSTAYAGM